MPAPAPAPSHSKAAPLAVKVGVLWCQSSVASTAAAIADILRIMNFLADMRPERGPVTSWHWMVVPPDEEAARADCLEGKWQGIGAPTTDAQSPKGAVDVIVIPGWLVSTGPKLRELSRTYQRHFGPVLQSHAKQGGRVLAVFNGASLLACCSLLAGRPAALPWAFAPSITLQSEEGAQAADSTAERAVPVQWLRDRRWHRDGMVWTTASLQDIASAMLDVLGDIPAIAEIAQAASHVLLFDPQRQLTSSATMQTHTGSPICSGSLEQARRWLQEHRDEPYSLQATARAASTSPRTLLRWFSKVYGETPLDYLHGLRIAQAQALLQISFLTVENVAQQCGYRDMGNFRKIFARISGVTPSEYRRRFKLRSSRRQWVEPGNASTA